MSSADRHAGSVVLNGITEWYSDRYVPTGIPHREGASNGQVSSTDTN